MKSSNERGLNSDSMDFPKRIMKAPSADMIIFGVMEREDGVVWTVRRSGVQRRGLISTGVCN